MAPYTSLKSSKALKENVFIVYLRGVEEYSLVENSIFQQLENINTSMANSTNKICIVNDSLFADKSDFSGPEHAIKIALEEAKLGKKVIFQIQELSHLSEKSELFKEVLLSFRELGIEIRIVKMPGIGIDDLLEEIRRGEEDD